MLGLPLLGTIVLSLWPTEPDRRITRAVGVGLPAVGFVLTVVIFAVMLSRDSDDRLEITSLWTWVQSGGLKIDLALQIDPLSVLMMLVIRSPLPDSEAVNDSKLRSVSFTATSLSAITL